MSTFRMCVLAFVMVLALLAAMRDSAQPALGQSGPTDGSPQKWAAKRAIDATFKAGDTELPAVVLPLLHASQGAGCAVRPPALLKPAQGVVSNDRNNPIFEWEVVPAAAEYIFQLAEDEAFQTVLVTERDVNRPGEDPVFYMAIWFLDKNHTYYWRVASVCDDGQLGAFSSVASFTMGSGAGNVPCTLAPPAMKSPVDGEQTDTLIPPFVWNSVPAGHEYRWQLAATDQFTEVIDSSRSVGINPTVVPTLERRAHAQPGSRRPVLLAGKHDLL